MGFPSFFTLPSFLIFSMIAHGLAATTATTFDYCVTSYGVTSISPVPTTFSTATVSTTKTTTFTTSVCTLTLPQIPIHKATSISFTTITKTITVPTQIRTSTITASATQPTVSVTVSATATVGISIAPKAKRLDNPVPNRPHGFPAVERRGGFPKKVYCYREVYIQVFSTSTFCKAQRTTATPTTYTFTSTSTITSTSTSVPTKVTTITVTTTLVPITRTTTVTVTQTSTSSTPPSTSTTVPLPTQSGVCDIPPTVLDTTRCPSVTATYTDDSDPENPISRRATFNEFYTGTGFYEDPSCSASLTGPGGEPCYYWYNMAFYDCSLSACQAVQRCVNDAIAFDYYSIDLHFRRSSQMWECAYFKYDKEFSSGSTAADFNQADPDVVVAYGYQD